MLYNGLHILTRVHTNDTCHYSSMFKNMILLHILNVNMCHMPLVC